MNPLFPAEDDSVPAEFKDLLTQAWHNDPAIRPSFLVTFIVCVCVFLKKPLFFVLDFNV